MNRQRLPASDIAVCYYCFPSFRHQQSRSGQTAILVKRQFVLTAALTQWWASMVPSMSSGFKRRITKGSANTGSNYYSGGRATRRFKR